MNPDRRHVLAGIAVVTALVAAVLLQRVLATVFFAITVAYVLAPVYTWFRDRGLSPWLSSAASATVGFVGVLLAFSPVVVVVYLRNDQIEDLVSDLPSSVTVPVPGDPVTITADQVVPAVTNFLGGVVVDIPAVAGVLALKVALFGLVTFGVLMGRDELHDAVMAVVPLQYRDVVLSLGGRARDTLVAIYILQAATAAATFAVAIPVFWILGYQYPFTLAVVAGVLQFVPIVGPSVLIAGMAAFDVTLGNTVRAVLVLVVGGVLIAWLPDPVVRPRLARETADLPGSLYFIGFTGGLLTLGIVGIIAGPLVVALVAESVELLAEEMRVQRAVAPGELDVHAASEGIPDAPAHPKGYEADVALADDPGDGGPGGETEAPEDGTGTE